MLRMWAQDANHSHGLLDLIDVGGRDLRPHRNEGRLAKLLAKGKQRGR